MSDANCFCTVHGVWYRRQCPQCLDRKTVLLDGERYSPGEVLRRLRNGNGMKQTELADELGTTQHTISQWERDCGNVTLRNFITAARMFGFRVSLRRIDRKC